jgi:predicted kinase
MTERTKLFFLCGKMAAGKSTVARELAREHDAVLLVQDEFLVKLFPGEIVDIPGFLGGHPKAAMSERGKSGQRR